MSTGKGWETHNGGYCPLVDGTIVFARFRDGRTSVIGYPVEVLRWRWDSCDQKGDIVAYQVVQADTPSASPDQSTSTRKQVLDTAATCVLQDRAAAYGAVEDNFNKIAYLWKSYLVGKHGNDINLRAEDVACMMILMKVARLEGNPTHMDSWVDIAGYAACGAEGANCKKE